MTKERGLEKQAETMEGQKTKTVNVMPQTQSDSSRAARITGPHMPLPRSLPLPLPLNPEHFPNQQNKLCTIHSRPKVPDGGIWLAV